MDDEIIVSTKERAGTFDGLLSAKPGEIIFVLQGLDPIAPGTILFWAHETRQRARAEPSKKKARRLFRKATAAEEVAWAMQAQQRGDKAVAGKVEASSGATVQTDAARERHEMLVKGVTRLHNSVAESNDFAEALAKAGINPEEVAMIRQAVELLREAADGIEPRHQLKRKAG